MLFALHEAPMVQQHRGNPQSSPHDVLVSKAAVEWLVRW